MNQDQIIALHKQIIAMDFKDIPAYIETLTMMGVDVGMFSRGTLKISFYIGDHWFSIYSPTWTKYHGNLHSKPTQALRNSQ